MPPGDAEALAGALDSLLTDPVRAEALVASGEERVQGFSMDRLADRYVELYERVGAGGAVRSGAGRSAAAIIGGHPVADLPRRCSPHGSP